MAVINFANEVMADGPSGFWRLGEPLGSMTAADETSNHNDGHCSPSGIKFGQPGFHGGDTAALFDGLTGRIVVPDSVDLNPAYITMEAKVSWSGWSNETTKSIGKPGTWDQRILEKSSFEGTAQYGLMISRNSPVTGPGIVRVEIRSKKPESYVLESDPVVEKGVEAHVAATYDGRYIRIYVNGDKKKEMDLGPNNGAESERELDNKPPPNPESNLGIGNESVRDRPFNGLIDEVAIYPAALSDERVLAHYQAQFVRVIFQYAAKFVCGTSKGQVVAPGQYFTAINVHNPTYAPVRLRAKLAVALPGLKPGPVSGFVKATLGPDEALEIDCPDIFNPKIFPHTPAKAEFLKGFVVIESEVELAVVAVYTAAGSERQVESIHTERVPARSRKAGASEASVGFEPPRG